MSDERTERTADRVARIYANEPQVRNATPDDDLSAAIRKPGTSLSELVATVMGGYADRPALGRRATELIVGDDSRRTVRLLAEFETLTYGEIWEMVQAVAAAWHNDAEYPVRAGTFVSMLGFTGVDYTVVDLACVHLGAVAVPLQAAASAQQLKPILTETEPVVLAVSTDYLQSAVDLLIGGASPKRVVVFDFRPEDDDHIDALNMAQKRLDEAQVSVRLETLQSVIERGREVPAPPHHRAPDGDSLSLLVYTSGSTGTPKGAIYTERMVKAMWLAHPLVAAINVNFTPLSHILGRISLAGVLSRGGTAYFTAKSDLSTLFDDIATVRPTELVFVPRVCDMVFERFLGEVERRATSGSDRAAIEAEVKSQLQEHFFGGRAMTAICGSAPLAPEMKAFIESVLGLRLHDGYGSTEVGNGAVIDSRVRRPPVIDYKLVDVPELGYFSTDKPYPRGELLLKTTTMFPGYYRRPELSREVFDHEGFYRTGDIVAETGPDTLVYVDRRNNVLKLSQGEFVTVAKVEAVFASSPLIAQIYVYGNSERAYLLAVIVPSDQWGGSKAEISASLQQIARDAELNPYEIPRDFLIETEPFTTAGGLLSGIGKLLRPKLKERYGDRLEDLYAELARSQRDELLSLRRTASDVPVLESINRAAAAVLGCSPDDLKPDSHFIDLGGDSLSALSFSILLNEIFGVEIQVGVVTSPTNDLGTLARLIEKERSSGGSRPTVDTVHPDAHQIRATDLTLEKFIGSETLDASLQPPADDVRTVLITGANGYLGRFLCLEWLERLEAVGGTVICVVRGTDEAAARRRLTTAFETGDPELAQRFRELAAGHLEVLPGDIGEPALGLDDSVWQRLATDVDLIVHSAALVNHVLPYRQLFGPNVVGTAELIRLALTHRIKPISFLSTVAVAAQAPAIDEDSDVREISPVRAVDDSYANGYGNSKWASEVLLREAHERYGLPVAVFRSDMILAHSQYVGQVNVPDMFTRLLLSLLLTGVAPESFYGTDAQGRRRRAHYEGIPVDFTAASITGIGVTAGFQTYNVVNPHDDDISLDRFVDWLIDAGYPIHRIEDYRDWFSRFENGLRSLPEVQRQHSVLPLLHAYRRPQRAIRGSMLPADRFSAAVRDAKIGPDGEIPQLSPELIAKYVSDLKLLGLLT